MKKIFNILSFFDGMSCGYYAAKKSGIKVKNYIAAEIKPHAIKLTKHHNPDTIHIGDVKKVHVTSIGIEIDKSFSSMSVLGIIPDLFIGGSPCQNISHLQPGKNIHDEKSVLFFEYLRVLKEIKLVNPNIIFLLENVVGDKESIDLISELLGVKPIRINASLVSYQSRDRYYWTNIPNVTIPDDLNISFQDYKETDPIELNKYSVNDTPSRRGMWGNGINGKCPNVTFRKKINCLTCKQDRWSNAGLVEHGNFCRYLTRAELEQAQGLPKGYTDILSYNQASDLLGDGWNVDVISHIFSHIDTNIPPIVSKQLELEMIFN